MSNYDLSKIVPQQPPMLFLSDVESFDYENQILVTRVDIRDTDLLFDSSLNGVSSCASLEFMAQSIACCVGLNDLTKQKDNTLKEIEKYKTYKKDYGNEITLSAHMIIEYGDKAWVLYAGNHNILSETYVNYNTYFEHIKYCKNKGIKIYDQFGTIGDLSKDNPLIGLHEFKKKFGGDHVEFIGEWDYITKPIMYFIFTKLVPIYRNIIKNKSKRKLKNELKK